MMHRYSHMGVKVGQTINAEVLWTHTSIRNMRRAMIRAYLLSTWFV